MLFTDNTVLICFQNMRSISKHGNVTVSDDKLKNNDIMGFTEAQMNPPDSTCKITGRLNFLNIGFNSNRTKYLGLTCGQRYNLVILDQFSFNGVSIFSFKKHAFANRLFTLMLI